MIKLFFKFSSIIRSTDTRPLFQIKDTFTLLYQSWIWVTIHVLLALKKKKMGIMITAIDLVICQGFYILYFLTSITKNTEDVISSKPARSPNVKASVWKTYCRGGKYITASWPITLNATAIHNTWLVKKPISTTSLSWDLDERAFHISKNTKQVNVMVTSLALVFPSSAND